MIGNLFGGGPTEIPGDKPVKSSPASSSSSSGDVPKVTGEPGNKPSSLGASKGQVTKAPTPESVIRNVQSGVDKLIGSLVHGKPTG